MRELSLTYTMPSGFLEKIKIFQGLNAVNNRQGSVLYIHYLPDKINPEGIMGSGNAQGFEWAFLSRNPFRNLRIECIILTKSIMNSRMLKSLNTEQARMGFILSVFNKKHIDPKDPTRANLFSRSINGCQPSDCFLLLLFPIPAPRTLKKSTPIRMVSRQPATDRFLIQSFSRLCLPGMNSSISTTRSCISSHSWLALTKEAWGNYTIGTEQLWSDYYRTLPTIRELEKRLNLMEPSAAVNK
jgi:hypothetical protein